MFNPTTRTTENAAATVAAKSCPLNKNSSSSPSFHEHFSVSKVQQDSMGSWSTSPSLERKKAPALYAALSDNNRQATITNGHQATDASTTAMLKHIRTTSPPGLGCCRSALLSSPSFNPRSNASCPVSPTAATKQPTGTTYAAFNASNLDRVGIDNVLKPTSGDVKAQSNNNDSSKRGRKSSVNDKRRRGDHHHHREMNKRADSSLSLRDEDKCQDQLTKKSSREQFLAARNAVGPASQPLARASQVVGARWKKKSEVSPSEKAKFVTASSPLQKPPGLPGSSAQLLSRGELSPLRGERIPRSSSASKDAIRQLMSSATRSSNLGRSVERVPVKSLERSVDNTTKSSENRAYLPKGSKRKMLSPEQESGSVRPWENPLWNRNQLSKGSNSSNELRGVAKSDLMSKSDHNLFAKFSKSQPVSNFHPTRVKQDRNNIDNDDLVDFNGDEWDEGDGGYYGKHNGVLSTTAVVPSRVVPYAAFSENVSYAAFSESAPVSKERIESTFESKFDERFRRLCEERNSSYVMLSHAVVLPNKDSSCAVSMPLGGTRSQNNLRTSKDVKNNNAAAWLLLRKSDAPVRDPTKVQRHRTLPARLVPPPPKDASEEEITRTNCLKRLTLEDSTYSTACGRNGSSKDSYTGSNSERVSVLSRNGSTESNNTVSSHSCITTRDNQQCCPDSGHEDSDKMLNWWNCSTPEKVPPSSPTEYVFSPPEVRDRSGIADNSTPNNSTSLSSPPPLPPLWPPSSSECRSPPSHSLPTSPISNANNNSISSHAPIFEDLSYEAHMYNHHHGQQCSGYTYTGQQPETYGPSLPDAEFLMAYDSDDECPAGGGFKREWENNGWASLERNDSPQWNNKYNRASSSYNESFLREENFDRKLLWNHSYSGNMYEKSDDSNWRKKLAVKERPLLSAPPITAVGGNNKNVGGTSSIYSGFNGGNLESCLKGTEVSSLSQQSSQHSSWADVNAAM